MEFALHIDLWQVIDSPSTLHPNIFIYHILPKNFFSWAKIDWNNLSNDIIDGDTFDHSTLLLWFQLIYSAASKYNYFIASYLNIATDKAMYVYIMMYG